MACSAARRSIFGSIEAVYAAGMDDYVKVSGITKPAAAALCDKGLDGAKKIIDDCEKFGIRILTAEDADFPRELTALSSPVQVLYALGTVPDWDNILSIAVVGTRLSTEYGNMAAKRMSHELAASGVTIVSGMARGIDSVAMKAAIRVGAPTVAVMGCGLESAYPPENRDLMNAIIETGCALSEYPPFSPPLPGHFPERNRIVCGLSNGVLAIEAPIKSGTLITAQFAMESGRTLFAVPGSIFATKSMGTNLLLKKGATAATCAKDILDAFPIRAKSLTPPETKKAVEVPPAAEETSDLEGLNDKEKQIITLLKEKDMHIEEISARSNMTVPELNGILPLLEIEGYILKKAGSIYQYNV